MAWRSSGKSNEHLVDNLKGHNVIETEDVAAAMKAVDRADFCQSSPYQDSPQSIGYGVTISAPHMVSFMSLMYLGLTCALPVTSIVPVHGEPVITIKIILFPACLRPPNASGPARARQEGP